MTNKEVEKLNNTHPRCKKYYSIGDSYIGVTEHNQILLSSTTLEDQKKFPDIHYNVCQYVVDFRDPVTRSVYADPNRDEWIKANLKGFWYNSQGWSYYFQNEEDAIAFKLKWL